VCPDIEDQQAITIPEIKTEPNGTVTTKEETDVSIHNKDDVTGLDTDKICEPEVSKSTIYADTPSILTQDGGGFVCLYATT